MVLHLEGRCLEVRSKALQEVFVVDDDPSVRTLLGDWLDAAGYKVRTFEGGRALLHALKKGRPLAICLDVMMPEFDGIATLRAIRKREGDVPVLVLTARDTVKTAVCCMRLGAIDYVVKPLDRASLLANLERIRRSQPSKSMACRVPPPNSGSRQHGLVGISPPMQRLYRQITKVACSNISVYIHGESGTGKELVATAIHKAGPRANGPFVPLNCGAIPESLQESELFGHEKGAFTGATAKRIGKFEQAQGGTIFLDEVAELSAGSQVRLLRVIQERRLERVGATKSVDLNIRVISATHRPLREFIAAGRFREDLFYRLVVYPLCVPPLCERGEDIAMLAEHFLRKYERDYGPGGFFLTDDALEALQKYPWPGNVRELENVVHGAMVRADTESISVFDLPPELRRDLGWGAVASRKVPGQYAFPSPSPSGAACGVAVAVNAIAGEPDPMTAVASATLPEEEPPTTLPASPPPPPQTIYDAESRVIRAAIEKCSGNLTQAAKDLGIARATLYRKIARYGLRDD